MASPHSPSGQTAIITGGASGLGLAIGRRLRSAGYFVAVFDRDQKLFAPLETEWAGSGKCFQVDVTDEASVKQGVEDVLRLRGKIEVLINSAGVTGKTNVQSHEVAHTLSRPHSPIASTLGCSTYLRSISQSQL